MTGRRRRPVPDFDKLVEEGIAQALAPRGTFPSQQVGSGSVRELTEAMIGPFEIGHERDPDLAASRPRPWVWPSPGSEVASLPMAFADIAAVIVFLRKVIWIVPGFDVGAYRPQLLRLHARNGRDGPFRASSERFLIECAVPPGRPAQRPPMRPGP